MPRLYQRHPLCLYFCLLSFLAAGVAVAHTQTPLEQHSRELALQVYGRLTASPVSDISLVGSATRTFGADEHSGTAVLKAREHRHAAVQLQLGEFSRREVLRPWGVGAQGAWAGTDGVARSIAPHNRFKPAAWFSPVSVLQDALTDQATTISYEGRITDLECLQVSRRFDEGDEDTSQLKQRLSAFVLCVDPQTLLPALLRFNIHPDDNASLDIPIEVRYTDYRQVGGVQIPHRIQQFLNNGLILDLQITQAAVNTGIGEAEFKLAGGGL